jgi:uncharacterized protein (DUF885 family)
MSASAAALAGCAGTPKPERTRDPATQLSRLMDEFFAEALEESPELATSLGLDKGERAAAKSRLSDASIAGRDARRASGADRLRRLKAVDRAGFTGMAAVNYDSVLFDLQATDDMARRFEYGEPASGYPYVLSQISGAWQQVPDFLATQHAIETREDCEAYLTRLEAFARVMDQEVERVRRDVGLGVIPPDFAIAGALGGMKVLRQPAATSSLVTALAERAAAKGIAGDWAGRATAAYEARVVPALDRQMALLGGLRGRAAHDAGCWRLPDGEAYYAQALYNQTTTRTTPEEVHRLGLEVTRELSARADELFRKIGYSQGTVGERFVALYASGQGVYPNTEEGKARLIADLNKLVDSMRARLPEQFATLPKAGVEIRRIPPATEQTASIHYEPPSLDGSRPGVYWMTLLDTAESPYWWLPTTTYHETLPGHHLQIALQQEAALPMLRRAMGFTAYAEGWALYSEQVAQEMGVYRGEPLNELGYIHDALLRSARLVTDTGLHHLRWSRERAIAEMRAIEGDPEPLATREIERYAVWPAQACSYMVGKVTLLRLREKARTALGALYDPHKFHDAVLLSGSMPLTTLEAVVDDYIATSKTQ